jgi:hypothetical protein
VAKAQSCAFRVGYTAEMGQRRDRGPGRGGQREG